MADFLFHEVSEKEKEDIKKQAKGIMDSFAKKLEAIDEMKLKESSIERDISERDENSVGKCGDINREIMFANAPQKNKDSIIAEKKAW